MFVRHAHTLKGASPQTALIVGRIQPKARVSAARRDLREADGKHLTDMFVRHAHSWQPHRKLLRSFLSVRINVKIILGKYIRVDYFSLYLTDIQVIADIRKLCLLMVYNAFKSNQT